MVEPIQKVSAQNVAKMIRVPFERRTVSKKIFCGQIRSKTLFLRVSDMFKLVISDKKFPKKCASWHQNQIKWAPWGH